MCSWFGGPWAGGWFGGGMLMMVLMFLFWGFIIWVGIMLVRKLSQTNSHSRTIDTPQTTLNILKERYAKGEISKEEFDRIKKDIE